MEIMELSFYICRSALAISENNTSALSFLQSTINRYISAVTLYCAKSKRLAHFPFIGNFRINGH